jgi:hypothetical protein
MDSYIVVGGILTWVSLPTSSAFPLMSLRNGTVLSLPDEPISAIMRAQWQSPGDLLSILMIIGGDIVQKALAQLSGGALVPVTFSFGWVAYAFGALMSAVGDGRIMPPTDCPSVVINSQDGYVRDNQSWVLGRLLRDFEKPCERGLRVVVFKALPRTEPPPPDWIWYLGAATIVLQLGIAVVPYALYGDWGILLITLCGTALAFCHGALPQWRLEKWKGRKNPKKIVSITRGNGSENVMVVLGNRNGIDLEDLAGARVPELPHTRIFAAILATAWLVLLITVAGYKIDSWYLLGIGLVGMAQNVVAAGAPRSMSAHGIPLEYIETIQYEKVMKTLQELEDKYPSVGASLLPVFFPGKLREDEQKWWDERIASIKTRKAKIEHEAMSEKQ